MTRLHTEPSEKVNVKIKEEPCFRFSLGPINHDSLGLYRKSFQGIIVSIVPSTLPKDDQGDLDY